MKKGLSIILMLALCAALLAGCGSTAPAGESEEAESQIPALTSKTMVIDGTEYTLPVAVSDLLADGWTIDEEKLAVEYEAGTLKDEGGSTAVKKADSDQFFIRGVYNPDTESAQPLSECMIMAVQFTFSVAGDTTLVLPGGATEKSTYSEILEAYGDPETTTDFEAGRKSETSLAYDRQTESGYSLNFGFNDDGTPSSFVVTASE